MTDYDELLARADFYLPWHGEEYDLIEDLAAALRAAVAERDRVVDSVQVIQIRAGRMQRQALSALTAIMETDLWAATGPATPTQENNHDD
jgi:hypothetical protein